MRIAIVGTGVAGLTAGHLLHEEHDLTLFEAADRVGGHVRTERVVTGDESFDVDTGFVVFNHATYPLFTKLLERLGVDSQPTSMSFSVSCRRTGLEYCGTSLDTVFADRRNLLRPSFLRMLRDILRFNRRAARLAREGSAGKTLGEVVGSGGYSAQFVEHYLVPMGAAIWSCEPGRLLDFPAEFFLRFFENHGLLRARQQLPWRVIRGGARRYVDAIIRPFRDRIRLGAPVLAIRREESGVVVKADEGPPQRFDHAILATHSDQALAILESPSEDERGVLGSIPYQSNRAVLHTDASLLPRRPRARASWNYHVPADSSRRVSVTYDMSRLQGVASATPLLVSLNPEEEIRADTVLRRLEFEHPVYLRGSDAAQARHAEISGAARVHFCGAYWGNGFHEDGVRSAVAVCRSFGREL